MNKVSKTAMMTALTFSLMLAGCSAPANTYGLTNEEYKLVDKYYEADKMVEELENFGYSSEEIERQLNAALAQVKLETGQ